MREDGLTVEERHNYRMLCQYHIFNAVGISLVCSLLITDMTCLHLGFDLEKFGIIKSNIYFLPSLCYFFLIPVLQRLGKDVAVCAWSYLIRCTLPILVPVTAIFCKDKSVLLWLMSIVTAIGFSAAMIANNTLLKIMRNTLPPSRLTQCSATLVFLHSLLSSLCGVFCVWLLEKADAAASSVQFYLLLAGMEIIAAIFEWPAISALLKVRLNKEEKSEEKQQRCRALSLIVERHSLTIIAYSVIRGTWTGMLGTYFVVYLMRGCRISAPLIQAVEFALCLATLLLMPLFGKMADKIGFAKSLTAIAFIIGISSLIWTVFPCSLAALILFAIVVYNGNSGIMSLLVAHIERLALMMQAPQSFSEFFIGINSLFTSIGGFVGCLAAGKVYASLSGDEAERLRMYFDWCNVFPVAMLLLGVLLMKLRPRR